MKIQKPNAACCKLGSRRSAFTLVEALISVTLTLIIMLALAQGFKKLSEDISLGRARLALSDQLRGVSELLRSDLSGITVTGDPLSSRSKNGYFMYYEGPVNDYTATTLPINNFFNNSTGTTTEQNLSTSKYGDFDDILAFTTRSSGDYFKGQVPLALVKGRAGATINANDWATFVTVASEEAEIVYFMMPEFTNDLTSYASPSPTMVGNTFPTNVLPNVGIPDIIDVDAAVNFANGQTVSPQDVTGTFGNIYANGPTDPRAANGTNAVPDRFKLCRRVLLILPELNVQISSVAQLYNDTSVQYYNQVVAGPFTTPPNGFRCDATTYMANAFQKCDLSMRCVPPTSTSFAPVAANTLADLAEPINRFGYTITTATGNTDPARLALTGPMAIQRWAVGNSVRLDLPAGYLTESGFLRPEFMRRTYTNVANNLTVFANTEVMATNCVGFDLKGYDPIARIVYNAGQDRLPDPTFISDGTAIYGETGSDDLVLSPSDPGYIDALRQILSFTNVTSTTNPNTRIAKVTSSQGAFVDLGWGYKLKLSPFDSGSPSLSDVEWRQLFQTPLSGLKYDASVTTPLIRSTNYVTVANELLSSQRLSFTDVNRPRLFQVCFDSFTSEFTPGVYRERISVNDPTLTRDSPPPFATPLSAIQAVIRLEDKQTSVIQQIAVTHDMTL